MTLRPRRRAALAAAWALSAVMSGLAAVASAPDPTTPAPNGPRRPEPSRVALTNATVYPKPGERLEHATVVIEGGRITQVLVPEAPVASAPGDQPPVPEVPGARIVDCTGLSIYPGLVEVFAEIEVPKPDPNAPGAHWNLSVTPQRDALDARGIDEGLAASLRKLGFGAAAIAPKGGIFKGTSAVVSLARPSDQPSDPRPPVYALRAYQSVEFEQAEGNRDATGRWPGYPDSLMGSIALVRQTLIDADWQARARTTGDYDGPVNALDALGPAEALPAVGGGGGVGSGGVSSAGPLAAGAPLAINVDDELDLLRAARVAAEFNRRAMIIGCGTEFRRLDAVRAACMPAPANGGSARVVPLVVPLSFPEKPSVNSVGDAEALGLRELMTWEQAPTNLARLMKALPDVPVAITSSKVRDRGSFYANVRKAMHEGLSEEQALAALTTTPARLLGLQDELGVIAPGRRANLVIADGALFAKKTKIRDVYVDGVRHEINERPTNLTGTYTLELSGVGSGEVLSPNQPGEAGGKPGGEAGGEARPPSLRLVIDRDGNVTIKAEAAGDAAPGGKPEDAKRDDAKPEVAKPDGSKKSAGKDGDKPKSARGKGVEIVDQRLSFVLDANELGGSGVWTFSGLAEINPRGTGEAFSGDGLTPGGRPFRWSAARTPDEPKKGAPADDAKGEDASKDKAPAAEGDKPAPDGDEVSGTWTMNVQTPQGDLASQATLAKGDGGSVSGVITSAMGSVDVSGSIEGAKITLSGKIEDGPNLTITGTLTGDEFAGSAEVAGQSMALTGKRTAKGSGTKGDDDADKDDDEPRAPADLPGYPFGPYARREMPAQEHVFITGATVWTAGPDGIIEDGEVELSGGKIVYVGRSRGVPSAGEGVRVIDAKGKHVTPGIIDCHSHTGISGGVNESGMAITAQVRIGDVTNPDAINWYRQLAGGVTCVNNLHGSANPMGGQNQVNKVRWGVSSPEEMHFEGAPSGIKFALGENVKQSNWGDSFTTRYPQSRMGVETIMRDRFLAAREYARAQEEFKNKQFIKPATGPRRDLQLEALAEILAGTRLVHCHSYRQDEILMMGRLATEFGFRLGTFQHILEGYKVAEVLRETARGASAFSDWWGYKVEVQDAIPFAGAIMHEQGIVVSFNSDSDELARRLNVEAGKAVRYSQPLDERGTPVVGGRPSVPPEEAIKFVTLNPAIQLGIEKMTGSLEVGKDADVVIWSGNPLSTLARAEATFVDGRAMFTLEDDARLRAWNAAERARLLQRVLEAKKKPTDKKPAARPPGKPADESTQPPAPAPGVEPATPSIPPTPPPTMVDKPPTDLRSGREPLVARMLSQAARLREAIRMDQVRRGVNPEDARAGVCGCEE